MEMTAVKISDKTYAKLVQKSDEMGWKMEDLATTILEDNMNDYQKEGDSNNGTNSKV